MAIVSVKVEDETYLKYGEHDKHSPQRAMGRNLKKFENVAPKERCLVVYGEARQALEEIFKDTIETPEELVKKIKKVSTIDVAGVDYTLTHGQQARLKSNAEFWGMTPEAWLQQKVSEAMFAALGDE